MQTWFLNLHLEMWIVLLSLAYFPSAILLLFESTMGGCTRLIKTEAHPHLEKD